MCSQKLEIKSFEVKGFQPCSPNTFFHPENKGETRFSQSENKKIPDTKNIKKTHTQKTQKRRRKKNSTKMKHPQMVASKQTPLWLFWDI